MQDAVIDLHSGVRLNKKYSALQIRITVGGDIHTARSPGELVSVEGNRVFLLQNINISVEWLSGTIPVLSFSNCICL